MQQEEQLLKEKLYGSMKPLPFEEYEKIFEATGLDVDGRRQLINGFIPSFDKCMKSAIDFTKSLPGFQMLPLEDQICVLKGTWLNKLQKLITNLIYINNWKIIFFKIRKFLMS